MGGKRHCNGEVEDLPKRLAIPVADDWDSDAWDETEAWEFQGEVYEPRRQYSNITVFCPQALPLKSR